MSPECVKLDWWTSWSEIVFGENVFLFVSFSFRLFLGLILTNIERSPEGKQQFDISQDIIIFLFIIQLCRKTFLYFFILNNYIEKHNYISCFWVPLSNASLSNKYFPVVKKNIAFCCGLICFFCWLVLLEIAVKFWCWKY